MADHDLAGDVDTPEEVAVELATRIGRAVDVLPVHAVPERHVAGPGAALGHDPPGPFPASEDGVRPTVHVEPAQDDLARLPDVHGGRPDVFDRDVLQHDPPAVEDLDERVVSPVEFLAVRGAHEVAAAVEGHAALAADHDGAVEARSLVGDLEWLGVHAAQEPDRLARLDQAQGRLEAERLAKLPAYESSRAVGRDVDVRLAGHGARPRPGALDEFRAPLALALEGPHLSSLRNALRKT